MQRSLMRGLDGQPLMRPLLDSALNQPAKGYAWTLNHNGVNSYIEIPEWKPTGAWEIEMDIYYVGVPAWGYIFDTLAQRNFIAFGHRDQLHFVPQLCDVFIDDIKVDSGIAVVSGFWKIKAVSNALGMGGVTTIGAKRPSRECFKGQITNIKLTDLDNPANSRFYPCIIRSETEPDSTVVVDELGGQHGTAINFGGPGQAYSPLLGAQE